MNLVTNGLLGVLYEWLQFPYHLRVARLSPMDLLLSILARTRLLLLVKPLMVFLLLLVGLGRTGAGFTDAFDRFGETIRAGVSHFS